jgi:ankyrin repeat protein
MSNIKTYFNNELSNETQGRIKLFQKELDYNNNILNNSSKKYYLNNEKVRTIFKKKTLLEKEIERNKKEYEETIQELEKNSTDINFQVKKGYTCLILAVCNNNMEVVKYLCENGADLEITDYEFKNTALFFGIGNNHTEVVEYLIEKGANINHRNSNGDSPLHFACIKGNLQLVKLLHQKGADLNEPNSEGNTPIAFCTGNKFTDVMEYLIENKVNLKNQKVHLLPLTHHCIENEMYWGLELLITADKTLINKWDKNFNTPLEFAVQINNVDAVDILLENGANPNVCNSINITPLYEAVENGNLELVKILVKYGVDLNVRPIKVDLCLIHSKPNYGDTPLALAYRYLHYDIANFLEEKGAINIREY